MLKFDAAVIGGGEAGIAAALTAADLGAKVCLVEKKPQLGGICIETGTLPSKAFHSTAKALETLRKAKVFGVRISGEFSLDFQEALTHRDRLIKCDRGHIKGLLALNEVEVINGKAVFKGTSLMAVEKDDGSILEIEAPRIILATGSQLIEIPGLPTNGKEVLSTDDLVKVEELPKKILVVGAGIVGCEYAFILESLGSEVILLEKLDHALFGQDKDIVTAIEREFIKKGIRFIPGTTVASCSQREDGQLNVTTDKGETLATEKILISIGRKPFTAGLNLKAVGVRTGHRGDVLVDRYLETTVPGIFAAGDVLGKWMLTSTAIVEGMAAAENALGGKRALDERFVPTGIYTDPEIASVGLTEDDAVAKEISYVVGKCRYTSLVKACTFYSHSPGFIKMIFDRESHRLLGAHIIGLDAAEIIHQVVFALHREAKAEDFTHLVYNHPSLSEGFREAALNALDQMRS